MLNIGLVKETKRLHDLCNELDHPTQLVFEMSVIMRLKVLSSFLEDKI